MAAGNPLYDIHVGIWTMLEAWAPWAALVKSRNRIKYIQTAKDAVKYRENLTADHVPEVAIVQAGCRFGDRRASNATSLVLIWNILITTADERFDSIMDLQWQTFRACLRWDTYLRDALSWNSAAEVRNCELHQSTESRYGPEINGFNLHRGIPGWASVWVCETECWFKHSALIDPTIT